MAFGERAVIVLVSFQLRSNAPSDTRLRLLPEPSYGSVAAVWSAAVMIATMFMASTLVTPLYLLYQQVFGFSTLALTVIYSTYVVGNLLALLFLGRISDELGRRRVILTAIMVAGASSALFLFAASATWLYWARMLSGVAIALASGAGTAWIAELLSHTDKSRAALIATSANFLGLAIGSLVAGCLAQYAPSPLELPFIAYLVLLAIVAVLIGGTRETVPPRFGGVERLVAPRIGIPRVILGRFAAPAITAFATFSLIGFYSALVPSLLSERLQVENVALAGAVVSELFVAATVAMIVTRNLESNRAMLAGLALLIPSLVCLVMADIFASLPILLADTALIGVAAGLGYRGSLQVINQIAPPERRAEVTSSYFIACFIGNSVPVIGVGWLTSARGPSIAISAFAVVVGGFVLFALALAIRRALR
jgi:MFS family permease